MTIDELVAIENESIRDFVLHHADVFDGQDVLDFGCGFQPYRPIVEAAGGRYTGWNDARLPGSKAPSAGSNHNPAGWDAILCTQVIEYVPDVKLFLMSLHDGLRHRGHLVITGPTNWPEVDHHDRHRLTRAGARAALHDAGFKVLACDHRAAVDMGGFELFVGWGALARVGR